VAETCNATAEFFGVSFTCPLPSAGIYRRICVHEHVRDGHLCADHVGSPAGVCKTCAELPGDLAHECPITLAPVTEANAS
jgi:hypothetical protein